MSGWLLAAWITAMLAGLTYGLTSALSGPALLRLRLFLMLLTVTILIYLVRRTTAAIEQFASDLKTHRADLVRLFSRRRLEYENLRQRTEALAATLEDAKQTAIAVEEHLNIKLDAIIEEQKTPSGANKIVDLTGDHDKGPSTALVE